jgi:hypothetical protein
MDVIQVRGQLLRPPYTPNLGLPPKMGVEGFRRREWGRVVVTIKDDKVNVAVTKGS